MDRAPYRAERKYDEEKAGGGKEKNKCKKKKPPRFLFRWNAEKLCLIASYAVCKYIDGCVKVDGDQISEVLWQQTRTRAWPDAPCVKWRRCALWAKVTMRTRSGSGLKGQRTVEKTFRRRTWRKEMGAHAWLNWNQISTCASCATDISAKVVSFKCVTFSPFFSFIYNQRIVLGDTEKQQQKKKQPSLHKLQNKSTFCQSAILTFKN